MDHKHADNSPIDLSLTTPMVCSNCGSDLFQPVLMFRTVPSIISPTGKAMTLPIETVMCVKCHHVNDEFNPEKRNAIE